MSNDFLDPYHRPTDRVSVVEEKIAIAAFSGRSLLATEQARSVPFVFGRPVLVAQNSQSETLLVGFQANNFEVLIGRMSNKAPLFRGSAVEFFSTAPPLQILLAGESLWVVIDSAIGTTALIVVEVTP